MSEYERWMVISDFLLPFKLAIIGLIAFFIVFEVIDDEPPTTT